MAGTPPPESCIIQGLSGQTITRPPGSVNGESLTLKSLKNCSVYILDHSSEVEASDCVDCELFIGPVDGPAIFADCAGCTAAVAAKHFQARRCADTSFSLFCGTAPSVSGCTDLTFTCWAGAYPGLAAHFAAAGLDPSANAWDKVHDTSGEDGGGGGGGGDGGGGGGGGAAADSTKPPSFKVSRDKPGAWWEVPLSGRGACENPVPAADGSVYAPSAAGGGGGGGEAAAAAAMEEGAPAAAPAPAAIPPLPLDAGAAVALTPAASLDAEPPAAAAAPAPAPAAASNGGPPAAGGGDHPRVAAMKAAARERLAAQEAAEAQARAATVAQASEFLAAFYRARDEEKARRAAAAAAAPDTSAAAAAAAAAAGKPAGDTIWERIASLVDLDAPPAGRDKAVDLGRAKAVLAAAKAKNLPA